jgi:hypothetical protein
MWYFRLFRQCVRNWVNDGLDPISAAILLLQIAVPLAILLAILDFIKCLK